MQVLVCLAEHAGRMVPKDRLMSSVWADTSVGDDVLTRAVSELRRLFQDDPKQPRVIETIPKAGYRLIAAVSNQADGGGPKSRMTIAGTTRSRTLAGIPSDSTRPTVSPWRPARRSHRSIPSA